MKEEMFNVFSQSIKAELQLYLNRTQNSNKNKKPVMNTVHFTAQLFYIRKIIIYLQFSACALAVYKAKEPRCMHVTCK